MLDVAEMNPDKPDIWSFLKSCQTGERTEEPLKFIEVVKKEVKRLSGKEKDVEDEDKWRP